MKEKVKRFLPFSLLITLLLISGIIFQKPDHNLHLIACDVGQGDGLLIIKGSVQVVIDGGPNSSILNCLSENIPFWDRQIELVVMTHPQYDHYRGLIDIVSSYKVDQLLANNVSIDNSSFWQLHQQILDHNIPVHAPIQNEIVRVGELEFKVLWPTVRSGEVALWHPKNHIRLSQGASPNELSAILGAYDGDLNETSIVLQLEYEQFNALFTGDLGSREELALVASGLITDVEVLKIAHHGSKFSSSSGFLEALTPDIALISVSASNRYGHPTSDTLTRLDTVGAKILRTDQMGTIHLITNGTKIWQPN